MARRVWAWGLAAALTILCACPMAAAEGEPVGWRVSIPMAGLTERLDNTNSGGSVNLIALADGVYTLSLMPLRAGGKSWVRALLAAGNSFFGICLLGTRAEITALKTLYLDIDLSPGGASLRFYAQADGGFLAAMELPLDLAGECRLLPLAQSQGVTATPVEAPPPSDDPLTRPAGAAPSQGEEDRPPPLRLRPGAYLLALLATALVLAALVLGIIYRRRIAGLASLAKEKSAALWQRLHARRKARSSARIKKPAPALKQDTREIPRLVEGPHLPGLRVTEAREEALIRKIVMRTAWEAGAEPSGEGLPAQMNEYFSGRASLPGAGRFLTVGLRNRDALQQLGGSSVRPLFAPNPRGQIFSLEEDTGGLYLHVDCFAPPSFVLQSVLRSVCLECVFALEDAGGNPLRLENALGYGILGLTPALTARTEAGFIVTQKGKLVIADH